MPGSMTSSTTRSTPGFERLAPGRDCLRCAQSTLKPSRRRNSVSSAQSSASSSIRRMVIGARFHYDAGGRSVSLGKSLPSPGNIPTPFGFTQSGRTHPMKRTFAKLAGLFVVAAAMAIAQTTPQAAAPAATPAQVRAHRAHKMMRALDLSPQQKQQAKSIFQNTRQQAQPLAQQLKQDRQSLSAAIQSEQYRADPATHRRHGHATRTGGRHTRRRPRAVPHHSHA